MCASGPREGKRVESKRATVAGSLPRERTSAEEMGRRRIEEADSQPASARGWPGGRRDQEGLEDGKRVPFRRIVSRWMGSSLSTGAGIGM